ncbi:MAG: TIGR04063 family PEP-CTERM/XrtA system glycosyltransferase [Parasphingorhabdus sp.]|nr:TIGR04063 family PEP-CTERM/XrtA system glycosyltransferase [Parasphingorhabdus sp.]
MTRILHILDHSLPLHSGYCFRTRAIMKAQQGIGHDVAGVTGVRHREPGADQYGGMKTIDGLDFYRTLRAGGGPSPLREWREVSALADRIVAIAQEWEPDVLHAHSPALNGLAAIRAGQRLGLPVLYEIRAFWEDAAVGNGTGREGNGRYWLTRKLEDHVIAQADAVAVICDGLKQDLLARGVANAKITVSPNGVDMEMFGTVPPRDEALAKQLDLGSSPVLGFIGSFYDYEGLNDLVRAVEILQRQGSDAKLLLVGGGPAENALRAQVLKSPAGDAIHFIGRVPHGEVERYYGLIDIMVYPRRKMRLTDLVTPLKPLEAMAQGRLVLASDVGGHRELIEDGVTGALFAADNPEALAQQAIILLSQRETWPSRIAAAQEYIARDRNWSSNILRYDDVYQRLLRNQALKHAA